MYYIYENLVGNDVPKLSIQTCAFEYKSIDYVTIVNEITKVKNYHALKIVFFFQLS